MQPTVTWDLQQIKTEPFDVYSAGGLGNNPRLGIKVAESVPPSKILYYIKAMWLTFCAYGNYENRAKARTRYMQDSLGGAENYKKHIWKNWMRFLLPERIWILL